MEPSPPKFIPPDLSIPRAVDIVPQRQFRTDAHHSYVTIVERLERAVNTVSARVRIDPASRVIRWSRALDRLSKANKRGVLEQIITQLQSGSWNHPFRDAFLALNESRLFIEITEQLSDYLQERDLRELISGHPDPAEEKPDARGRDKEFEWFVAALCRRAGLPVALAEPDLLIDFRGHVRSIAVKRLSSRKNVGKNISKASAQIKNACYPGYVFLDITKYMDPEMLFVTHWRNEGRAVQARLQGFAEKPEVANRRNELVRGVFLRAAFPHISPGFVYGTAESWTGVNVSADEDQETLQFLNVFVTGLRGT